MTKAEHTKQLIIEKAAPVFNKKGYTGTTLSDLTKSTGLTKGALYGHFKNKDELAIASFDFNINRILSGLKLKISQKENPVEKLLSFPQYFLDIYGKVVQRGGCPIMNTAIDTDDTHEELNKRVKIIIINLKNNLISIIEEGQKQNLIGMNINPARYASLFLSLFEGGLLLSKTTGDKEYFYNNMNYLIDIIQNKIRKV